MNKRKIVLILCLIIGVCSILVGSVAYYRIVVSRSIKVNTGNAVFVLKDSDNSTWSNKVISLNNGNKINPGDSGSFTVKMDASGSNVDMYATLEIDRGTLPTNLKFYTTSDKKSELHKYYSFLETTNQVETLTIYWYWNPYIDDTEDNKFINKSNLEATIKVNAVQISEYATIGYISTGGKHNLIRTITFGNDLSNLPSSCTESNLCWDISYSSTQNKRVYNYLVDSGLTDDDSNTLYNLYIVSEAPMFARSDCSFMFQNYPNLISINFNNNFNTSKVTNMYEMFSGCSSLTSLDLSNFNTSKVTKMDKVFYNCSSLTSLDLNSFNTSKVTSMGDMFNSCSSLKELDLSSFNTSNVTDMHAMFNSCSSLKELDLSSFNTSNVTDMYGMFRECSSLTELDLSNFNTSKVTRMDDMFSECSSLTELDLSSFDISNVTNMYGMFYNCSSLTTEINIIVTSVSFYNNMFMNAATVEGSQITVNYIADASDLVDSMLTMRYSKSNVVKGSVIPEYTITISGNDDITYERLNGCKGTTVTLTSVSGDYWVTSFKMNGNLIKGNTFTMPDGNVTITDIEVVEPTVFETTHNPYLNSQSNVVIGEKTFEGATSLTVILDYQTEGASWDYFYIYDSASATTGINNNKKYGGSTRTKETITINGNYIKITFTSDSSGNNYYGLKAIVIPNY